VLGNSPVTMLSSKLKKGGMAEKFVNHAVSKATKISVDHTGKSPEEWVAHAKTKAVEVKESLASTTTEWHSRLTQQMDSALTNCDHPRINALLDSAMAGSVMQKNAPKSIQRAASQVASRQLKEATATGRPAQLKGALVAAKRLNAMEVPEFALAVQKYKEVKKMPAGFDVEKMVLHRKGDKMVAKMKVDDPAVKAKFQRLLDLTYRRVYTRDRLGQAVPERLELVSVSTVTNDDLWADYMARRESVRQELAADPGGFREFSVDTAAPGEAGDPGESAESIAASLAADFAEPLLKEVNEVFLFHGTSAAAADKITTAYFKINLAGSNAGTLYGRGLYLAENATKSDEYTRPGSKGERHLLLCRATLGRAYYLDAKDTDPRACEDACLQGSFHSVLGDRRKCRGTFREFVLFDEEQVYPNYILTYRRANARVDAKRSMQVECPKGVTPGSTVQAKRPDGTTIHVLVPAGIKPGQKFVVQY